MVSQGQTNLKRRSRTTGPEGTSGLYAEFVNRGTLFRGDSDTNPLRVRKGCKILSYCKRNAS